MFLNASQRLELAKTRQLKEAALLELLSALLVIILLAHISKLSFICLNAMVCDDNNPNHYLYIPTRFYISELVATSIYKFGLVASLLAE